SLLFFSFFFFNLSPNPELFTLSLHDALPISKFILFYYKLIIRPKKGLVNKRLQLTLHHFLGLKSNHQHLNTMQTLPIQYTVLTLILRLCFSDKKQVSS